MGKIVIEINNLSKQYRLGQVGATTVTDDFKRWWYAMRGKEDPFLKIGEENDRSKSGNSKYVWALKDINFSVEQGDVLGIIGKNGAGKSTLLKILSRTTTPTIGEYKIKGRVASLLEVGTGFHPDLTGRENIFLNGAILGMSKQEIHRNFDEIVAFSGVERYIDTPVKRYSSGMYVRLAFAVAAHLDPEILIVDEVLAVGDTEFQKKCLGKMKDVSGQGRTVLFVSHNITAIRHLCTKCVLLKNGTMDMIGSTESVILKYSNSALYNNNNGDLQHVKRSGVGEIRFTKIAVEPTRESDIIRSGGCVIFKLQYEMAVLDADSKYEFVVGVWNSNGTPMFMVTNQYLDQVISIKEQKGSVHFVINRLPLNKGNYVVNLLLKKNGVDMDFIEEAYSFEVENGNFYDGNIFYPEHYEGVYIDFSIEQN